MLGGRAGAGPEPGPWQAIAQETLHKRMAEPEASLAAFVVDRPGRPAGLAACAIGVIEQRLGDPGNPSGEYGYVFNVATDQDYRRRGFSRACMLALLDWYWQCGVHKIDLKTSVAGEPLYRSLGFSASQYPLMRLRLS